MQSEEQVMNKGDRRRPSDGREGTGEKGVPPEGTMWVPIGNDSSSVGDLGR